MVRGPVGRRVTESTARTPDVIGRGYPPRAPSVALGVRGARLSFRGSRSFLRRTLTPMPVAVWAWCHSSAGERRARTVPGSRDPARMSNSPPRWALYFDARPPRPGVRQSKTWVGAIAAIRCPVGRRIRCWPSVSRREARIIRDEVAQGRRRRLGADPSRRAAAHRGAAAAFTCDYRTDAPQRFRALAHVDLDDSSVRLFSAARAWAPRSVRPAQCQSARTVISWRSGRHDRPERLLEVLAGLDD
jgi:hypothetical protein